MTRIIKQIPISTTEGGAVIIESGFAFGSPINIDINANTNNLVIPNLAGGVLIRMNFTGNYSLTGIVPIEPEVSIWIIIDNVGSGTGSIKDNSGSSDPANRFLLGANRTVQTNEGLALVYDPEDMRWRSFALQI